LEHHQTVTRSKVHVSNIFLISVIDYLTNNSHIIANAFNKYFLRVAENIIIENVHEDPLEYLHNAFKQLFPNIKLKYTTTNEIEEIIKSLKTKNSHGYSGISAKILKLSMLYISSSLTYMCNKMISSCTLPTRLKLSEIHLLFKKDDKMKMSNYRPISLLTSFSKIFKYIIYRRLYHHIN